jgi:ketol-acid reductoisomerase
MLETKVSQMNFKVIRRAMAGHPIEEVGAKLRGMMRWISKNAVVDKAKH